MTLDTNNKEYVNLFRNQGTNELYETIRTRNNEKDREAVNYWNQKYENNRQFLDKKFVTEFPHATESKLWELTIADFLRRCPEIELIPEKNYGKKNQSKPDFCFIHHGKRHFLEATVVTPGQYPQLGIKFEDSIGIANQSPREEYKEKVCSAITSKIERYNNGYQNVIEKNDGFIIAISSAPIRLHIHPRDYLIEASCLFGLSERQYNRITKDIYCNSEETFSKLTNGEPIKSDYFVDDRHSYISGIIFSNDLAVFYPQYQDLAGRMPVFKQESIVIHNPFAKIRLPIDALPIENQFENLESIELAFNLQKLPAET